MKSNEKEEFCTALFEEDGTRREMIDGTIFHEILNFFHEDCGVSFASMYRNGHENLQTVRSWYNRTAEHKKIHYAKARDLLHWMIMYRVKVDKFVDNIIETIGKENVKYIFKNK